MELIPYIGTIIGPDPADRGRARNHPISALWVLIAFIALQQLEGHVVAPQVFRIFAAHQPDPVILSLLIGYKIYGSPERCWRCRSRR